MPKFTDKTYLQTDQYRDAGNLNARIAIHEHFSTNPQGWFPWVWDILSALPAEAKVLELGCGSGALWSTCPERIPAGWSVTLSDFSAGMLDSAWRSLVTLGRGFKFEQIDAQQIPYPDETFDIVIANFMLYHIPDRPKALAEIRRVIKKGGVLVAATAGAGHLKEMQSWFEQLDATMDIQAFRNPFTLENGMAQLDGFFNPIELHRYADGLRITETPPLMAYLKSSTTYGDNPESIFDKLEQELTAELQTKGAIEITKDSGLFLAIK
ncbi:MAG: class I SAM-dependent methyltransferase [Chloroflexi bacterium HGW-Chloroflexi-6]|nr:MAG: class I SAM-dependent methyltransferase [Chloroflexi bacterium HGW-Chloroflexi-6]